MQSSLPKLLRVHLYDGMLIFIGMTGGFFSLFWRGRDRVLRHLPASGESGAAQGSLCGWKGPFRFCLIKKLSGKHANGKI